MHRVRVLTDNRMNSYTGSLLSRTPVTRLQRSGTRTSRYSLSTSLRRLIYTQRETGLWMFAKSVRTREDIKDQLDKRHTADRHFLAVLGATRRQLAKQGTVAPTGTVSGTAASFLHIYFGPDGRRLFWATPTAASPPHIPDNFRSYAKEIVPMVTKWELIASAVCSLCAQSTLSAHTLSHRTSSRFLWCASTRTLAR